MGPKSAKFIFLKLFPPIVSKWNSIGYTQGIRYFSRCGHLHLPLKYKAYDFDRISQMALRLPNFDNPHLVQISACTWLPEPNEEISTRLTELSKDFFSRVAKIGEGAEANYLRLIIRPSKKPGGAIHVHIDYAHRKAFGEDSPNPNVNSKEILDILGEIANQKAYINGIGTYRIPWNSLPENGIIRAARVAIQIGTAALEQTAATFKIKGAPLTEIEWKISDKDDDAEIDLSILSEGVIDDDVLMKSYIGLESAWLKLVMIDMRRGKDEQ